MRVITLTSHLDKTPAQVIASHVWVVKKASSGTTHLISHSGAFFPVQETVEQVMSLLDSTGEVSPQEGK